MDYLFKLHTFTGDGNSCNLMALIMRTKIVIGFAVLALGVLSVSVHRHVKGNENPFLDANVEALARIEGLSSGRYMTVGCGGYNFAQWKTYCCPNSDYNNCPDRGTCSVDEQYIFGCL